MAEDVHVVGSRVSVMHLTYDCLGCTYPFAVTITDGKDPGGHRCLVQQPRDCPNCRQSISITLVAELAHDGRVAG